MSFIFPPAPQAAAQVAGHDAGHDARYAVTRIFCVAKNYAAHVREMGGDPKKETPFFFMKPASALVANGAPVPYPPRTADLHHEIELVVAIGKQVRDIAPDEAEDTIFGYAVGNDLTRRDLQAQAKDKGRPWDTAKGFDHSAPLSAIHPVTDIGHIRGGRIWLSVNGTLRQQSDVKEMINPVPVVIAELSSLFTLHPGDLIFTGTPEGVGPLKPGDRIEGGVAGVDTLTHTIA